MPCWCRWVEAVDRCSTLALSHISFRKGIVINSRHWHRRSAGRGCRCCCCCCFIQLHITEFVKGRSVSLTHQPLFRVPFESCAIDAPFFALATTREVDAAVGPKTTNSDATHVRSCCQTVPHKEEWELLETDRIPTTNSQ